MEVKLDAGRSGGAAQQKMKEISDASEKLDAIGVSQGNLLSKTKGDVDRVREAEEEKREEGSRQEEKKEEKEVSFRM